VLLDVRDLRVTFARKKTQTHAVNGVSFTIDRGETLGVVGESGSGKSVTAMSITRLLPTVRTTISGQILFDGRDLLQASSSEMRSVRGGEIGMVFQDPMTALNPVLSVERQLTESLELHKHISRREARTRAIESLGLVGIPDPVHRIDDYPHQFSGGMRQRVMIAMAIACEPKLLIADEPTTALDVTIQAQIIELIGRLRTELGMAIMWISHDLGVVAGFCDRTNVMYAGKIMEHGTVDEIFDDPRNPYTIGLLGSIPRLDGDANTRLRPIPGQPPDMSKRHAGCPFHPRCAYAIDRCAADDPALLPVTPAHESACWVDVGREVLAR
jgi:oligopeptide transport system ATP-binding protein